MENNLENGYKPEVVELLNNDSNLNIELNMFAEDMHYADNDMADFANVLHDNNLMTDGERYANYNPDNLGCNPNNPFAITNTSYFNCVKFEYGIVEWITNHFADRFIDIEFMKQEVLFENDKTIDCLSFSVKDYENDSTSTENYYFDITEGIKQRDALFNP